MSPALLLASKLIIKHIFQQLFGIHTEQNTGHYWY